MKKIQGLLLLGFMCSPYVFAMENTEPQVDSDEELARAMALSLEKSEERAAQEKAAVLAQLAEIVSDSDMPPLERVQASGDELSHDAMQKYVRVICPSHELNAEPEKKSPALDRKKLNNSPLGRFDPMSMAGLERQEIIPWFLQAETGKKLVPEALQRPIVPQPVGAADRNLAIALEKSRQEKEAADRAQEEADLAAAIAASLGEAGVKQNVPEVIVDKTVSQAPVVGKGLCVASAENCDDIFPVSSKFWRPQNLKTLRKAFSARGDLLDYFFELPSRCRDVQMIFFSEQDLDNLDDILSYQQPEAAAAHMTIADLCETRAAQEIVCQKLAAYRKQRSIDQAAKLASLRAVQTGKSASVLKPIARADKACHDLPAFVADYDSDQELLKAACEFSMQDNYKTPPASPLHDRQNRNAFGEDLDPAEIGLLCDLADKNTTAEGAKKK